MRPTAELMLSLPVMLKLKEEGRGRGSWGDRTEIILSPDRKSSIIKGKTVRKGQGFDSSVGWREGDLKFIIRGATVSLRHYCYR